MSYGDGGFYFLQQVGMGATYGNGGYGYAEALPSAKEEKAKSWRTTYKGYDVVRRPKSISSDKERKAWVKFFKAKQKYWEKQVSKYKWIAGVSSAAALAASPVTLGQAAAGGLTYAQLKTKYNSAKARVAWYKSSVRFVQKAAITVKMEMHKATPDQIARHDAEVAKANAAAAVEADAALVAESKDIPEATAEDKAAADPETPEAKADDVAEVEPAAAPEAAVIKAEDVKTVSTDAAPEAKAEETFMSKYGMYIGGAVVLGGAAYFFRDSLGFGDKKS